MNNLSVRDRINQRHTLNKKLQQEHKAEQDIHNDMVLADASKNLELADSTQTISEKAAPKESIIKKVFKRTKRKKPSKK